jgi:hypothetical protein
MSTMLEPRLLVLTLLAAVLAAEQPAPARAWFGGRTLLHAHNAYPEKGRWDDRLDRALNTGLRPMVIEQDIALAYRGGDAVPVVSHDTELTGHEPTLESYFFTRVAPEMTRALAEGQRARWPLLVLHLDFKSNEPDLHRAVWRLLQRHAQWLTTAPAGPTMMPVTAGPLLVLTENGPGQEAAFAGTLPAGGRLLLFGSAAAPPAARIEDPQQRARALAAASPDSLIPDPPTNFRRWVNFSWQVVEAGGQQRAGAWTADDAARLRAIVDRGHTLGYLVRFYNLNGHAPSEHLGWTVSYNLGSLAAVQTRWAAAIAAGVDLLATDQYEALGTVLRADKR